MLVVTTAATGIGLWASGRIDAGVVAMALPLAWQISNMAGWVSWEIAGIFENSARSRRACSRSPSRISSSIATMPVGSR